MVRWYILYILIKSLSTECASALYGKMVHSLYLNKVFINSVCLRFVW